MPHLKQIGDHRCGPRCACRQVSAGQPCPEILPAGMPDHRGEVATLAHDFGNLLQVAASALSQIERSFDPARDAALCALSQAGTAALLRAGVLNRALLGQRVGTPPEPILPSQALAAIAPLLALAAGPLVEVGFEIPDDAPPVACEIHEFENAVLNLVTNARNAMPGGGALHIRLTRREETMLLRVADNGLGMRAATMAFAFAPGFTTRQAAGGRGLGLAAVRHFAERNGGWVEIDSTPGKGTAITIGLPGAAVAYPHSNGDQG